jgi:D-alanyl-D-alanine carboxypeptidase (penicillin-binding protein 5/6)
VRRGTVVGATFVVLLVAANALGAPGTRAGPPPTPVPPSGSPSPYPQTLHTPPPSTRTPAIRAAAAILVTAGTGQVLYAKHPWARRAIASLTKLMTATIAVRARSLAHTVTVTDEATRQSGSTLGLRSGERIPVRSLLYAILLQSSNDAASALANDISGTADAFVGRMNLRARQLQMTATRFVSPNGLDDRGYSTASDLATLTRVAIATPSLVHIMQTRSATIANPSGPARHIQNRNALLWLYPGVFGVKTGFTTAAGQCLITAATHDGRTLVAVVLGDVGDRVFDDSATLLNYGFTAFVKARPVRRGDRLGTIDVDGVPVDALAGEGLTRLMRTDRLGHATITLHRGTGVSLPVAVGDPLGRAVISVAGSTLGSVPAVAAIATAAPIRPIPPPARPRDPAGPLDLAITLLRATFGSAL